ACEFEQIDRAHEGRHDANERGGEQQSVDRLRGAPRLQGLSGMSEGCPRHDSSGHKADGAGRPGMDARCRRHVRDETRQATHHKTKRYEGVPAEKYTDETGDTAT